MKISEEFDTIVGFAREEAMRTGSCSIGADHLFLGLLRHGSNAAVQGLIAAGIDLQRCKQSLDSLLFHEHSIPFAMEDEVRLGRDAQSIVNLAIADAMAEGAAEAGSTHLLRAICRQEGSHSSIYLKNNGYVAQPVRKKEKPATGAPEVSMDEMQKLFATIRINNSIPS